MRSCWVAVVLAGCGSVSGMDIDARPADSPATDSPDIDAPIDSSIDAPPCVTLTGTVGRWRGEQNTSDSAGTYNGNSIGANFGYTPGKHGSAFLLDGVDDGVTIDDMEAFWPAASFTLEAWVKTTSNVSMLAFTKYACGASCPSGQALSYFGLAVVPNGIPQFDLRPEADPNISTIKDTLGPINNGAWHHLVGVRDNATSKQILYVDGVERVSANLAAIQLGAMTDADGSLDLVTIGTSQIAGQTTFDSYFNGAIDDVAIYSRALSAAEVAAIYAAPDGVCP